MKHECKEVHLEAASFEVLQNEFKRRRRLEILSRSILRDRERIAKAEAKIKIAEKEQAQLLNAVKVGYGKLK